MEGGCDHARLLLFYPLAALAARLSPYPKAITVEVAVPQVHR